MREGWSRSSWKFPLSLKIHLFWFETFHTFQLGKKWQSFTMHSSFLCVCVCACVCMCVCVCFPLPLCVASVVVLDEQRGWNDSRMFMSKEDSVPILFAPTCYRSGDWDTLVMRFLQILEVGQWQSDVQSLGNIWPQLSSFPSIGGHFTSLRTYGVAS